MNSFIFMPLLVTEQRPSAATLPQSPWKRWKIKTSHMKYGLFFLMIFMMITAVKVYLNYANIQQNITDVKAKIIQRQKDMQYLSVQNAYLFSPYAYKVTAHQEGILLADEQFILFDYRGEQMIEESITSGSVNTGTTSSASSTGNDLVPSRSWIEFFRDKIDRIP